MAGRFDLPYPDGTCYLSSDDLGALLELLGPELLPGGCAPATLLADRHIRRLCVPRPLRLADTLAEKAARWVTAEIATITPHEVPQMWARAWRACKLEGIRYAPRHSASSRRFAVALFGLCGERRSWRRSRRIPIGDELRARLRDRCGIVIFDVPTEDEIVFAR